MPADHARRSPFRFFGILRESPSAHFHLLQIVVFAYVAWRFLSRNYSVYGLFDEGAFDWKTTQNNHVEFWPRPPLYFTGTQFLYAFLPRPGYGFYRVLQYVIAAAAGLGLLGLVPRLAAFTALLGGLHFKALMVSSNGMTDGGTLAMAGLFVLMIAPREAFYGPGRLPFHGERSTAQHWPIAVFWILVGAFYTYSGVNKVIHFGLFWPFRIHIENLASMALERAPFVSSRHVHPEVCRLLTHAWMSHVSGAVTLIGEVGFISILVWPRGRFFFAMSMIVLHALVFALQAINFLGSSCLLLLCLDWNACARRVEVSGAFAESAFFRWVRSLPTFGRIVWKESGGAAGIAHFVATDEDTTRYEGLAAVDQIFLRSYLLWPFAVVFRLPGAIPALEFLVRAFRPGARAD